MEIDLNSAGIRLLSREDQIALLRDLEECTSPIVVVLGELEDGDCEYTGIVESEERTLGSLWVEHHRENLMFYLEELL